jgi:hypothetical protein
VSAPSTAPSRLFSRTALVAGAIATVAAGLLVVLRFAVIQPPEGDPPPCERTFVRMYDPPRTKVDTMLIVDDGQAWAVLAQDPTFADPEVFCDGAGEFVYRAQRPMYGWIVWAASFGQPAAVPVALMVVSVLGVGLLAAAGVALAEHEGRLGRFGGLVALMPGAFYTVITFGPEALATGLCLLAIVWWTGPSRRPWAAVAALTVAVLCRDILVVVPAAIGLFELVRRVRPFRSLLPLGVPVAAYLGWIVSLKVRYGSWPSDRQKLERLAPPFRGLWQALAQFDSVKWFALLLAVVLLALAVRRSPRSMLTWIALAFAAVGVVLGENVWVTQFYRVLLPMYALALIAALPADPHLRTPPTRPSSRT